VLSDAARRDQLRAAGTAAVTRYDWATVARDILSVYETVTDGAVRVSEDPRVGRRFGRFGL
jgi:phosphatidylinositol alpha-mannosyltransferase